MINREDDIMQAKGVLAGASIVNVGFVGKKNYFDAIKTLQKYGLFPAGNPRDYQDTDRACQFQRECENRG